VHANPAGHGESPIAVENAYPSRNDPPRLLAKKLVKSVLATAPVRKAIRGAITLGERAGLPDRALVPLYRLTIGIAIFRGWRDGLNHLKAGDFPREPQGTAYPTPA
jgi:hypothetical protein